MSPRSLLAFLPVALLSLACSGGDSDSGTSPPGTSGQGGSAGKGGSSAGTAGSSTAGSGQGGSSAGSSQAGTSQGGAGNAGNAGNAGDGGGTSAGSAGAGGKIPCETTNDCAAFVPETKPAGCAKALCDADQKFCRFVAKDLDGDGDPSNSCKSNDATISIELGGDCDETDDRVNSQAWDGPEGLAGGEAKPGRCEGLDNDCNGVADDGKLDSGESCKCEPGQVRQCSQDSAGKTINYPGNTPVGECKYGAQTCSDTGKWGPCTGAVGPALEECNGKDDDCDGSADEIEDVLSPPTWTCDADSDNHAAYNPLQKKQCSPPTEPCGNGKGSWTANTLPLDDCDDFNASRFLGNPEVCDSTDNDCDEEIDEGALTPATWYLDADKDGHVAGNSSTKVQCSNPGDSGEGCPPGVESCSDLWTTTPLSKLDCDDNDPERFPGNWDGPATGPYGVLPPGFSSTYLLLPGTLPNQGSTDLTQATSQFAGSAWTVIDADFGFASAAPATIGGQYKHLDWWGVRWKGTLRVPPSLDGNQTPVTYTFRTRTDDTSRLIINGQTILDNQGWGTFTDVGEIALTPGSDVTIEYEFADAWWSSHAHLEWKGPGILSNAGVNEGFVPLRVLGTADKTLPDRCDGKDNDCSAENNYEADEVRASHQSDQIACPTKTTCSPGQIRPCNGYDLPTSETSCGNGIQRCSAVGVWGSCEYWEEGSEQSFYNDGDSDGYCNLSSPQKACAFSGRILPHQTFVSATQKLPSSCNPKTDCNEGNKFIYPGASEVCDGQDNDCSGVADDNIPGLGASCGTGLNGICSSGKVTCKGAQGLSCVPDYQPNQTGETCNGKDDDCDGSTDEDFPGKGSKCLTPTGLGICRCGYSTCTGGTNTCTPTSIPGDYSDFHSSPLTCVGNSTWDWNCNGSEEPEVSPTGWNGNSGDYCKTKTTQTACNQGNPNNLGVFLLMSCPGNLCPYPGCGAAYHIQQCWWKTGSGCQIGATGENTTIRCR